MLQCPWYVGLQQPFFAVDITLSVKAVGKKLEIVIEASLLYYNGFGFFSVGQITKMCKLLWKRERESSYTIARISLHCSGAKFTQPFLGSINNEAR